MSGSVVSMDSIACTVCLSPARYTCPRCSTSTCSLPCSRSHKSTTGCSGERNKAAYVQMNAYGWGTMMRDYCFLEEIGRNVSAWGGEIAREGFASTRNGKGKEIRGRGSRGAQASGRVRGGRGGSSKRDLLKVHLENLDVEMEVLPIGMQRRKVNQSSFDTKTQTALLTIEFKFHPGPLSQPSSSAASAYTILAHRNSIHSSIIDLLRRHIPQHSSSNYPKPRKENPCPDWVTSLIHPHPDDPEGFKVPHCYLPAQMDLTEIPYYPGIGMQRGPYYYKICPSQTLQELLQGTHFVEFPTIHVYDPDSSTFVGNILTKKGQLSPMSDDEHAIDITRKRRKLNAKAGKKAISGLVGEYGSDSESISEKAVGSQRRDELGALGSYTDSTAEDDVASAVSFSDDEGDVLEFDPAALLELIKQAQGAADHDAEAVDWGDDWDEDITE